MLSKITALLLLGAPCVVQATTLDELFRDVKYCKFQSFFYAPWSPPIHPYFSERNLTPYKAENDTALYYFKLKETLFDLPVSELIVPGTRGYHIVIFDAPYERVQAVLKKKFGTTFSQSSAASDNGKRPLLDARTIDGRIVVSLGCSDPLDF